LIKWRFVVNLAVLVILGSVVIVVGGSGFPVFAGSQFLDQT